MDPIEFEGNWMWSGGFYSQLVGIGGILLTTLILISTGYFNAYGAPLPASYLPHLGLFYKHKGKKKRPVRVYMDGCFDLMHYGHANALRQAKALGDELVVGVVSDEQIVANKGPPVLSMEERLILVKGLKWVDEVIPDAPYEISEAFMNKLFNKYNIDYIIHGDDPCLLPDGTDAYASAKKAGRYKQIKRTEGVSSTDIVVGVALQVTKLSEAEQIELIDLESQNSRILSSMKKGDCDNKNNEDNNHDENSESFKTNRSDFLPTSHRIMQFSNGKGPLPNSRVVYIDGAFDLFHAGHVEILRSAKKLGDFLLVGVHDDQVLSERRGRRSILQLHERSLSVLGCRYVDEVIIGAPWEVSKDMIATFNISVVVHGTVSENNCETNTDPYAIPKSMGIFQTIKSPRDTTTLSVAKRIIDNLEAYKQRNLKKKASEDRYYSQKTFVAGD